MSIQYDGLIVKEQSGFYWVEVSDIANTITETVPTDQDLNQDTMTLQAGDIIICRLRGKLKEEAQASDIAAIGDRVTIFPVKEEGTDSIKGIIEHVHPRENTLSRAVRTHGKRGTGQAEREHVLIANVDQVFLVFSGNTPTPNFRMMDHLLVATERAAIPHISIVINKIDMGIPDKVAQTLDAYTAMGYEVLQTSAKQGLGIDEIRARIDQRICVFTGPSGVGKTSLLNAIQPDLGRTVKEISEYSQEGVHTTRDSALVKLENSGYIADTPGIRQLNLWDVEPDELDGYFVDIAPYVDSCRFNNCTHTNEPHCAVRKAVKVKAIHPSRYENYLHLREELAETYITYQR